MKIRFTQGQREAQKAFQSLVCYLENPGIPYDEIVYSRGSTARTAVFSSPETCNVDRVVVQLEKKAWDSHRPDFLFWRAVRIQYWKNVLFPNRWWEFTLTETYHSEGMAHGWHAYELQKVEVTEPLAP